VADSGPGIDPATLPHVFDRFVKGQGSRGSGLGLAIARDLVVAHGGKISVESQPAAGTTFTVRLPIGGGTSRDVSWPDSRGAGENGVPRT
jgi:signal transduction histidine kinase